MNRDFHETVARARRGERAAFDSLFARNLPALVAFIRARTGGALVERESISDLAQSVCREALMDLDDFEFRGEDAFRGWLFLHATRKIVDRYRFHKKARRDLAREQSATTDEEAGQLLEHYATLCTPSRHAGAREELGRVETALQELPGAQREAVLLSRIANLSYAEIARQKGISESAIRGLVARGLAQLAQRLGSP